MKPDAWASSTLFFFLGSNMLTFVQTHAQEIKEVTDTFGGMT